MERCVKHVRVIRGAEALAQNVLDADCIAYGTHCATGLDSSSWAGGLEDDVATTVTPDDFMRDGVVGDSHFLEALASTFSSLADGFADFLGFAKSEADTTRFVTNDKQCAKAETATPFDDFGAAIDENGFFNQLGTGSAIGIRRDWSSVFARTTTWATTAWATTTWATVAAAAIAAGSTGTTTTRVTIFDGSLSCRSRNRSGLFGHTF